MFIRLSFKQPYDFFSDVNECEDRQKPCEFVCQNIPGSYKCACPRGYVLNMDGKSCRGMESLIEQF